MSKDTTYLSNAQVTYIDALYEDYKLNPDSVDFGWRKFFEGFELGQQRSGGDFAVSEDVLKEINVLNLIKGYRTRGHLFTKTNPVRERRKYTPSLAIENFGLTASDLDKVFNAGVEVGVGPATLRSIIQILEATYCESIGAEYIYIRDPEKIAWLQQNMESTKNQPNFSIEEKRQLLYKLNQAVVFENFLHTKFVGQKRFSLEGAETLIAAMDGVINRGAELGIEEYVIGMAHRGRLNVLANIMGKTYDQIFKEFEGKGYTDALFEGDVKYHLGYSSEVVSPSGKKVKLTLSPNPSHLEAVNPVVEGISRAKQDYQYNNDEKKLASILIHGDASIAGQGIIYEVQQMGGLKAYKTGGTIHIVINNQIGFTTNYIDGRTSTYCTDVAKVTLCPVFHVNGDDVEAVAYAVEMAMNYRQKFNTDVYVDLLCYRKYGHNEGDEPRFTQPLLYKSIEKHANPREIYQQKLSEQGKIEASLAKEMEQNFRKMLQERLEESKQAQTPRVTNFLDDYWKGFRLPNETDFNKTSPNTKVTKKLFKDLAEKITNIPSDFKPIAKVQKLFADRKTMIAKNSYDWAMGELMAYATLQAEGFNVRMSGQDCERGTFSHRHAVIKREDSEEAYIPLANLGYNSRFEIYNSLLSEYAVLGFEYGYALTTPKTLTLWEAQFGDFGNGAQIIIDQFISSAGAKWKTGNGLVMLLPHGYEGQGPEHSSARLERFLQLAANYNMQVCYPSSPASMFHLLRRQMHRDFRIPLVIMTPKSLLRHPVCVSSLEDFTTGGFNEVIDDSFIYTDAKKVKKVLFCSGKIYYELLQKQQEDKRKDIAIVRVEQLYPMPENQMDAVCAKYSKAEYVWVQEEPKNAGAWTYLLRREENWKMKLISRNSSASPATGFSKVHALEQAALIDAAFS